MGLSVQSAWTNKSANVLMTDCLLDEEADTKGSKGFPLWAREKISTKYVWKSKSSTAIVGEEKMLVEGSPGMDGEGTDRIFFDQVVYVEVVCKEAPHEVGVQPVGEVGVVFEGVPSIHDGEGGIWREERSGCVWKNESSEW